MNSTYGYIINENYQLQENEIKWNFQRLESDNSIKNYNGIECFDGKNISTSDYVIIGNAREFNNWLLENGEIPLNDII